jgi:hypothetical protein
MAAGGEPERFLKRIHETWVTWRGYFAPVIRQTTSMVLLLDHNFYKDMDAVVFELELTPLDCEMHEAACATAAALDQGYKVFTLNTFVEFPEAKEVIVPENPFVIFISLYDFPHPLWIERQNSTEADILTGSWHTEHCNKASYAYTKFTNWYSYHMFTDLRILDYFDYWWKIDDDVRWFNHLPLDLTPHLTAGRKIFFHTELNLDPWWCIGPPLAQSVDLFLNVESELCGRLLNATAHDEDWWTNDTVIYLSEFVGGWLGLYTSPELLEYGRIWNYYENAMWKWRWGDQQFWTKANGMFDDGSGIDDFSYLKQVDTSTGPPKGTTSMIFYHG